MTNGGISAINVFVDQDILMPTVDAGPGFTLNCYDPVYSLDGNLSDQGMNFDFSWTHPNYQ